MTSQDIIVFEGLYHVISSLNCLFGCCHTRETWYALIILFAIKDYEALTNIFSITIYYIYIHYYVINYWNCVYLCVKRWFNKLWVAFHLFISKDIKIFYYNQFTIRLSDSVYIKIQALALDLINYYLIYIFLFVLKFDGLA